MYVNFFLQNFLRQVPDYSGKIELFYIYTTVSSKAARPSFNVKM